MTYKKALEPSSPSKSKNSLNRGKQNCKTIQKDLCRIEIYALKVKNMF